jgi:hypothetical protein
LAQTAKPGRFPATLPDTLDGARAMKAQQKHLSSTKIRDLRWKMGENLAYGSGMGNWEQNIFRKFQKSRYF